MALIRVEEKHKVTAKTKEKFDYRKWYEENKQRLSEKKAQRYREDPSYREKALERSRNQKHQKKEKDPIDDDHPVSFADMAEKLGVSLWQLREWRRKDYFPEPHHRENRLWFKTEQEPLLLKLREFLGESGRMSESKRRALDEVVSFVYSNW